jgi:hypothetical protein
LKKEIYIHVGPPKTGTSAVQKWLSSNQFFLKKHGVFYPSHSVDANGVSSGNVTSIYDVNEKKQLCLNKVRLTNLIDTFNASEYSILLLSSEFFFREMDEFKLHIPNAKFIAYIRNPIETKESGYNQSVKRHFQIEKMNIGRIKRLPYIAKLAEFTEIYGTTDLYLRLYGEQYFKGGNIVSDLLSVIGIEVNVELPLVNNSYQFEALEFKRWFNQFHLENYQVNVDRALQGFSEGSSHYSLIPEEKYIEDSTYYAELLESYAKKLNTGVLEPLVCDMKRASSKPYFPQELSENRFLLVCQYLQKSLQFEYYLMTKEIMPLTPVQNKQFHDLFINSYNKKFMYLHLMLTGRNKLRKVVKNCIKVLSLKF